VGRCYMTIKGKTKGEVKRIIHQRSVEAKALGLYPMGQHIEFHRKENMWYGYIAYHS